jgi:hypothetical protein
MADSDLRATKSRRDTSGAASQGSGASLAGSIVHRVSSGGTHLDSQYYGHDYQQEQREETIEDDTSTDESDFTEREEAERKDGQDADIVPEVRDGIEDQRDVEAGPKLEKSKTTKSNRSARDPNLVGWERDDPKNPKNWSMGRKWSATLIGTYRILPSAYFLAQL